MPDAQDENLFFLHAIFGRCDQLQGEALGGKRAELRDIAANGGQVGPRLFGPDYSPHLGGGNSLGVPQDSNQRFMAS